MKKAPITPEMKVADLLNHYPELEDVLISIAPAFSKLKNRALRLTVARVTSLRQAAQIGGVGVADLVNQLRRAAGMEEELEGEESEAGPGPRPGWLTDERIGANLDIRPILENGEKPLAIVFQRLEEMPSGSILELTAPFLPAPLIDVAKSRGLSYWWRHDDETVKVFLLKPSDSRFSKSKNTLSVLQS